VDRSGPGPVNLVCMLVAIAAAALLVAGDAGGSLGIVGLAAGMLLLDVAVQCGQVVNQSRIFALAPEARSRLNTAYMTSAFIGGTAGSLLGVCAYAALGWTGVCALVSLLAGFALTRHLTHLARPRQDRPRVVVG
jgi:predicted MFS family arabinose efflux permease